MGGWMYGCMKILTHKYCLLIISALFFACCGTKPPIPEDKFIQAYVDLLILKDTTNTGISSFDSLKTEVYKKHNLTFEQYNSTLNFYKSNPDKWEEVFDKAIAYAETMRDSSVKKP